MQPVCQRCSGARFHTLAVRWSLPHGQGPWAKGVRLTWVGSEQVPVSVERKSRSQSAFLLMSRGLGSICLAITFLNGSELRRRKRIIYLLHRFSPWSSQSLNKRAMGYHINKSYLYFQAEKSNQENKQKKTVQEALLQTYLKYLWGGNVLLLLYFHFLGG